jgi:chromate transporter
VLFFFPVWHNLKKYAVIFRSLEGIRAAVVGIMAGAVVYLLNDHILPDIWLQQWPILWDLATVIATFFVLKLDRVPAPFIVIGCLILGAIA